jgi:hypothetical protein
METSELLMMLGDFLVFLGACVAIFLLLVWAGSKYLEHLVVRELGETLKELDEDLLVPLTVEVDNNLYLCYNSLTQDFVCQGIDLKEILERFHSRYPNKKVALYNGDETAIKTLKLQLKELGENISSVGLTS